MRRVIEAILANFLAKLRVDFVKRERLSPFERAFVGDIAGWVNPSTIQTDERGIQGSDDIPSKRGVVAKPRLE